MPQDFDERAWFHQRKPNESIVSRPFSDREGRKLRIVSKVVDGDEGLQFATIKGERILRVTPSRRWGVKATLLEDERHINVLTIQRWAAYGPLEKEHFSFVGKEITALSEFLAGIKTAEFPTEGALHLTDEAVREIILNRAEAQKVFSEHEAMFVEIAQSENLQKDLIAVGYRRKQLERFERLLSDPIAFESELADAGGSPERVWQMFFEQNTWIFGYGLAFQFLSALSERKLEQIVRGHDLTGAGKRADAVMRTNGLISSLCFVEIKRHDTPLLGAHPYRAGCWAPSSELSGAISQVQTTVHEAVEAIGRKFTPASPSGDPTGETVFNVEPRSFLVVGSLDEFRSENGVNEPKYRSFELLRQNTKRPEIVTFDELLERARFIVEQAA